MKLQLSTLLCALCVEMTASAADFPSYRQRYEAMFASAAEAARAECAIAPLPGGAELAFGCRWDGLLPRPFREGRDDGARRREGHLLRQRQPATEEESVLAKCEIGFAAMNQGAYACVDWSFVDYPDPFVAEDGDTPEERAAYEAAKCGFRMDAKYNKFGVFRWGSTDRDYRAYAELYAMGWLVKLFRKNATVLPCSFADPLLRGGAVLNPDLSFSAALVNRGPAKTATVDCSSWKTRVDGAPSLDRPLRKYVYEVGSVPYNPFGDLQPPSGTVEARDGAFDVDLPANSIVFLTTDYEDRQPAAVKDVRLDGGALRWTASEAPEHRYYRVFHEGHQIASTVAEHLDVACQCGDDARVVARRRGAVATSAPDFRVVSVDKWGNEGK